MLEGLRSPNIHTPENLGEFSSIIQNYPDSSFWAGGTYIMTRKDSYPGSKTNEEIIYLGSIEEIHRFQRNDRTAEFGAMVTLEEILSTGHTSLPEIIINNLQSIGGSIVRSRITIGGSLCTPSFRSSIPGTLSLFDTLCEVRYMKKKRMQSKWFPILSLYDKSGRLNLPDKALVSRIRINLLERKYQKFLASGDFFLDTENAVSLAISGNPDQDSLDNVRIAITLPNFGFLSSHDLDNIFSGYRFPLDRSESQSIEDNVIRMVRSTFPHISHLQQARTSGLINEVLNDLNLKALTEEASLTSSGEL